MLVSTNNRDLKTNSYMIDRPVHFGRLERLVVIEAKRANNEGSDIWRVVEILATRQIRSQWIDPGHKLVSRQSVSSSMK